MDRGQGTSDAVPDHPVERQLRAKAAWDNLDKPKLMTARAFEAKWEEVPAEMDTVGMRLSELQKYLHYMKAIGRHNHEHVISQRREFPDGAGGFENREAKTWKEAHKIRGA